MVNDTISRQAAIDAVYDAFCYAYCDNCDNYYKEMNEDFCGDCLRKEQNWSASKKVIERVINNLPSTQPERKKGKWIDMNTSKTSYMPRYKCSICNDWANKSNFCPNCGADMRGDK